MSKRRKPPPGFKSPRQRMWDVLKWILVLLAAFAVYQLWTGYGDP
jgi:hypothetical protein